MASLEQIKSKTGVEKLFVLGIFIASCYGIGSLDSKTDTSQNIFWSMKFPEKNTFSSYIVVVTCDSIYLRYLLLVFT